MEIDRQTDRHTKMYICRFAGDFGPDTMGCDDALSRLANGESASVRCGAVLVFWGVQDPNSFRKERSMEFPIEEAIWLVCLVYRRFSMVVIPFSRQH